jgi:hypothetical protein
MPLIFAYGCTQSEDQDEDPGQEPIGDEVLGHVEEMLMQNLFLFTTAQDFELGETYGTVITSSANGEIVLEQNAVSGTYTSPIIKTSPFQNMILSWNADTPKVSYIEIQGRVRTSNQWSGWLSWGKWSSGAFTDEKGELTLPGSAPKGGHLVLVRGFTWKDGVEYVIVNDPAAADNDSVRLEYKADEFAKAWTGKVAYIIYRNEEEVSEGNIPSPLAEELVPVGDVVNNIQQYQLIVNEEPIKLDYETMRSMNVSYNGEVSTPIQPLASMIPGADLLRFDITSKSGRYTYTFMDMFMNTYQATIQWKK